MQTDTLSYLDHKNWVDDVECKSTHGDRHTDVCSLVESALSALLEQMFCGAAYCQMLYVDGRPDDFVYLYTNPAFHLQTGLPEVHGKRASAVTPELRSSDPELLEIYGRVAAGGVSKRFEKYVEALGQWLSVQVLYVKPAHILVLFDVITHSKQLEQANQEALRQLQQIASRVPGVVYQYKLCSDGSSCFPWVSDAIHKICHISPEAIREDASALFALLHAEDYGDVIVSIQTSALTQTTWKQEFRIKLADGSVRWLYGNAQPEREPDGSTLWHGFFTDISERKQAEAALRESEKRFHLLADNAPVLVWMSTPDKLCDWFNDVWLRFTGRSMAQELGNGWADGVHPNDLKRCLDTYVRAFDAREEFQMEYRLRRFDGEYRWLLDNGVPRYDEQDNFLGYIGSCVDITDRKKAEEERNYLLAIIEDAQDFIATSDMQARLKYLNPAGARLVGLPENVDLSALEIKDMHPVSGTRLVLEEGIPAALAHGSWQHENFLLHRDGHQIAVSQVLLVHRDAAGKPYLLSTIMRDISASKKLEEQVRQMAFYDLLTELPNRRLLLDRLNQLLLENKRSALYGAMIFLDLDNFKPLNDAYGHDVGDLLLMEVARRLKGCVRENDTVSRFGGDEFVVLLSSLAVDRFQAAAQTSAIAEKIRVRLAEPYLLTTHTHGLIEYRCAASIGIIVFNGKNLSQKDILRRADAAMYQAKSAGRNTVRFYEA